MLLVLINVMIIVVIGVICFSLINWFVRGKPGNVLKILVALICLAAIVQQVLSALGVSL